MNIDIKELNNNLVSLICKVISDDEIIAVNTKNGNAVIISEEKYNSLCETIYLNSQPGLIESVKKAEKEDIDSMKSYDGAEW